jgi:hypothetical protein
VLLFVAAVVHSCSAHNPDLVRALEIYLTGQNSDANVHPKFFEYYLRQFGHHHDMQLARMKSRWLRQHFEKPAARLVAFAYESFAASFGRRCTSDAWWLQVASKLLRLADIVAATIAISRGKKLISEECPAQRAFFNHYSDHLWIKLWIPILRFTERIHSWLRKPAERVLQRNRHTMAMARRLSLLELATSCHSLEAELLIALKRPNALAVAKEVRAIRMCYGTVNEVILAELAKGWAELNEINVRIEEECKCLANAIAAFARGASLAFFSTDDSLRWKLSANLVRVLYGGNVSEFESDWASVSAPKSQFSEREVASAFQSLSDQPEHSPEFTRIRLIVLWYLKELYAESPLVIKKSLLSHFDIRTHPLYSPPSPPKTQVQQ